MEAARNLLPYLIGFSSHIRPRETANWASRAFLTPARHRRPFKETLVWEMGEEVRFPSGRRARLYGETGPVVVLVHGWEGRSSQFHEMISPLALRGFQVLAWDGPAHGDSPGLQTNLVEFSNALIDDLRSWPFPLHALVGHSFGGAAVGLAKVWGLSPKALVLIGAPSRISSTVDRSFEHFRLSQSARHHFLSELQRRTGFRPEDLDLLGHKERLDLPTLIVHDLKDRSVSLENAREIKAALPQSRLLTTTDLGHYKILKSSAVAHQIVEFLEVQR